MGSTRKPITKNNAHILRMENLKNVGAKIIFSLKNQRHA